MKNCIVRRVFVLRVQRSFKLTMGFLGEATHTQNLEVRKSSVVLCIAD